MKKTLITLLTLSATVASAATIGEWEFNNSYAETSGVPTSLMGAGTAKYVDSMTAGTVLSSGYKTSEDLGKAIELGNGSWLNLGSTTYKDAVNLSKSFTLGAYIKFNEGATYDKTLAIFGTGDSTSNGLAIGVHRVWGSSEYEFVITHKGNQHYGAGANTALTANTWHHMAISYDSTSKLATWYLDGVVASTQDLSTYSFGSISAGHGSAIGSTTQNTLQGANDVAFALDRVQVFNTALDGVAIRSNAGLIPEPTTATLSLLALAGLAARRRRK